MYARACTCGALGEDEPLEVFCMQLDAYAACMYTTDVSGVSLVLPSRLFAAIDVHGAGDGRHRFSEKRTKKGKKGTATVNRCIRRDYLRAAARLRRAPRFRRGWNFS